MSDDGRLVSFSSSGTLEPSDTNGFADVYLRDLTAGTTERVSLTETNGQANGNALDSFISGDGTVVGWFSDASNVVAGDTNSVYDAFVRDLATDQTEWVTAAPGGTQGNGQSIWPRLSGDGTVVLFMSDASNLVANDTNGAYDPFVHERGGSS